MLIGFHGQAQSGKDTAAERLAVLHPGRVTRVAFADRLYAAAAASIGVPVEILRQYKTDPDARLVLHLPHAAAMFPQGATRAGQDCVHGGGLSVREYLQLFGTEGHRDVFGDNFWVESAGVTNPDDGIVVVTDVRFDNEAEHIHDLGGTIWHVHGRDGAVAGLAGHASEAGLSSADFHLDNTIHDDDFVHLDRGIDGLMAEIDRRERHA